MKLSVFGVPCGLAEIHERQLMMMRWSLVQASIGRAVLMTDKSGHKRFMNGVGESEFGNNH
jgi:hypothetical protein